MPQEGGAVLVEEPWPPVAGRPGLCQGRYGDAGNLELVACAVDDGLWVGWFNTDPVDHRRAARRLGWSGALRFGRGRRYVAASIAQVEAGDGALEVLAVDADGDLVRHVWTADDGFREHGVVARGCTDCGPVTVEVDASGIVVHAARIETGEGPRGLRGAVTAYPSWSPALEQASGARDTAADRAAVRIDGATEVDDVRRVGDRIVHRRWSPDGELRTEAEVVAEVWVEPGAAQSTLHRG